MAAGLGFKTFTTGEVLTAADVNGYLMQGVLVFATEAARNSAITSPQEGQFAFTKDNNSLWYYTGSAWAASGATGDIEGVTAGTGISGGGTSGTVTITNSMATAIDAKGDLVVGTGADTFSRLAVGTNGQVLTADSGEATGLKFATPAAGGMTSLASGTLSGTSLDITSISSAYNDLVLQIFDANWGTADDYLKLRFNNLSTNIYFTWSQGTINGGSTSTFYGAGSADRFIIANNSDFLRTGENTVVLTIPNYAGSQNRKQLTGFLTFQNSAPNTTNAVFIGMADLSSAIDRITVSTQSGYTFSSGTYRLWGVK